MYASVLPTVIRLHIHISFLPGTRFHAKDGEGVTEKGKGEILTFITTHFCANQIPDFASAIEICNVEVCRDARGEEASGCDREGAPEVDHGGYCAAVEDREAVLVSIMISLG